MSASSDSNSLIAEHVKNRSYSENYIPCSMTARIPSSEQIIAGKIRDDEMLLFKDLV